MSEHKHQFIAILIASVVLRGAKRKCAMCDMISKIAQELKRIGRKLIRVCIDSAYCRVVLRFVSIEEPDKVPAMVLEALRGRCGANSFKEVIQQHHRPQAAGFLEPALGYTLMGGHRPIKVINEAISLFQRIADKDEACERCGVSRIVLRMVVDVICPGTTVKSVGRFKFPCVDFNVF